MPLPKKPTVPAAGIGRVSVYLGSASATTPIEAVVNFDRLAADGTIQSTEVDLPLVPHLTNAQQTAIANLLNAIRAKALAEAV